MTTSQDVPEQPDKRTGTGPDTGADSLEGATAAPESASGLHPDVQPAQEPTPPPEPGTEPTAFPAPHQARPASAKFFQWIRNLGVVRGSNRWMGGVCSGLADKWGIDPVIVRGLAVVLTLFFGIGLLIYGVAWALLPEPDGRIHVEEVGRGHWSTGMTGAGILTFVGLIDPGQGFIIGGHDGWFPWPLFWIAGVVWLIYWAVNRNKSVRSAPSPGQPGQPAGMNEAFRTQPFAAPTVQHQTVPDAQSQNPTWQNANLQGNTWQSTVAPPLQFTTPQPFQPDPRQYVKHPKPAKVTPRLGAAASFLVLGLAAVVGAVVLLLDATNILDLNGYQASVAAAAAAITAAAAIIVAGLLGRTAGGLGTFAIIALVFGGLFSIPVHSGPIASFNTSTWAPVSISTAEAGRTVVFGNATVDLTKLDVGTPLSADVNVPLDLVASNVTIQIPKNIPVQLKSQLAAASLTVEGQDSGGGALADESTTDLNPQATGYGIIITLQGAAANINVTQGNIPVGSGR